MLIDHSGVVDAPCAVIGGNTLLDKSKNAILNAYAFSLIPLAWQKV